MGIMVKCERCNKTVYGTDAISAFNKAKELGWTSENNHDYCEQCKDGKMLPNIFTGGCYVIRNKEGDFIYGECEGTGNDFEMAYKFNDSGDSVRFLNHNRQYDNGQWEVHRVLIKYEII